MFPPGRQLPLPGRAVPPGRQLPLLLLLLLLLPLLRYRAPLRSPDPVRANGSAGALPRPATRPSEARTRQILDAIRALGREMADI